jgi:hypothetical protein
MNFYKMTAATVALEAIVAAATVARAEDCYTYCGEGAGGLANFMGYYNFAMLYANHRGVRFLHSAVAPPAHNQHTFAMNEFKHLLGPAEWTCASNATAAADPPEPRTTIRDGVLRISGRKANSFKAERVDVDVEATWTVAGAAPGCGAVTQLRERDLKATTFDYSATRDALRDRYWRARPPSPPPPSGVVAARVHYRLGDIAGHATRKFEAVKRSTPGETRALLDVLAKATTLNNWTMEIRVVTDSPAHAEVRALEDDLRRAFPRVLPAGASRGARSDLDELADADVLVCLRSGFARFAAVLARGVVLAPAYRWQPLAFENSIQLPDRAGFDRDKPARRVARKVAALLGNRTG